MERSREKVDLADWYGNSWATSQKFFFVAIWLVLLCGAPLSCCVTLGPVERGTAVTVHNKVSTGRTCSDLRWYRQSWVWGYGLWLIDMVFEALNANPERQFLKNIVNLWKLMKTDVFPCKHQDKNKKEGHLTMRNNEKLKWKVTNQSGSVVTSTSFHASTRTSGEALIIQWLHCHECSHLTMPVSYAPHFPAPKPCTSSPGGSLWSWDVRPLRPRHEDQASNPCWPHRGSPIISQRPEDPVWDPLTKEVSRDFPDTAYVHLSFGPHSTSRIAPASAPGCPGHEPPCWGRQGRWMRSSFPLPRDSRLSLFSRFYYRA